MMGGRWGGHVYIFEEGLKHIIIIYMLNYLSFNLQSPFCCNDIFAESV
jgi:hypothetical protein